LACQQLVTTLACEASVLTVTLKNFGAAKQKLDGRLTPELLQLYSVGFDGAGDSLEQCRGMGLLEKLQKLARQFRALEKVMALI
jgi:hypothetical protein